MKTLTLIQPWATLIMDGRKAVETRSWNTNYRGRLAIHAGKRVDKVAADEAGYRLAELPRGAILGTVELVCVHEMTDELLQDASESEKAWGDWKRGRFAWYLGSVSRFPQSVQAKGMLGLWKWEGRSEEED